MLNKLDRNFEERAIDIINVVAGAALAVSPWLFGFADHAVAAWNAALVGVAIALVAAGAMAAKVQWNGWASLILGAWAAISPWALGFFGLTTAMGIHLILGLLVAVLAAIELWFTHNRPLSAA